jgi:pimeloyl-ACP methyl ester carboxylesterase
MTAIELDGVRLAYQQAGSAEPWITLVHGGLVATYSWRFQLPHDDEPGLTSAGRVLCFDQRGYGASSSPPGGYDIAGFAGDLERLWDALGVQQTFVVGFSMGGFVALEAAVRAPERIAGLVLESCGEVSAATRQLFSDRADAMDAGRFGDEVALHVRRAFSAGFADANAGDLEVYTDLARKADPRALATTFRSIAAWDLPPESSSLTCPVLMVNGEQDPGFGPDAGRALQQRLPRATQIVLPGAGHTAHYEQPAAFNRAVADFVATTTKEQSS